MNEDGYWGQLKAWNVTGIRRVGEESFIGLDKDGIAVHIDDPAWMTDDERDAALAFLRVRLAGPLN